MNKLSTLFITLAYITLSNVFIFYPAHSADQVNPHTMANKCIDTPCETDECVNRCELICDSCHSFPLINLDLTDPTVWNPDGKTLNDIYPSLTKKELFSLGDLCQDCHGEKHLSPDNHPVDIQYIADSRENDLAEEPDGTPLVCTSRNDCQIRCVSCHKVHPSEKSGQQIAGLLQVKNQGSALCASCHTIAGE